MSKKDPLDQVRFVLSNADWRALVSQLETPSEPTKALIALMRRKPIWDMK